MSTLSMSLPSPSLHQRPATNYHPMQEPTSSYSYPSSQYSDDLEKLRRLKELILSGQHPDFKPVPRPDALEALYLGPKANNHSALPATVSSDGPGRDPRAQSDSPVESSRSNSKGRPNPSTDQGASPTEPGKAYPSKLLPGEEPAISRSPTSIQRADSTQVTTNKANIASANDSRSPGDPSSNRDDSGSFSRMPPAHHDRNVYGGGVRSDEPLHRHGSPNHVARQSQSGADRTSSVELNSRPTAPARDLRPSFREADPGHEDHDWDRGPRHDYHPLSADERKVDERLHRHAIPSGPADRGSQSVPQAPGTRYDNRDPSNRWHGPPRYSVDERRPIRPTGQGALERDRYNRQGIAVSDDRRPSFDMASDERGRPELKHSEAELFSDSKGHGGITPGAGVRDGVTQAETPVGDKLDSTPIDTREGARSRLSLPGKEVSTVLSADTRSNPRVPSQPLPVHSHRNGVTTEITSARGEPRTRSTSITENREPGKPSINEATPRDTRIGHAGHRPPLEDRAVPSNSPREKSAPMFPAGRYSPPVQFRDRIDTGRPYSDDVPDRIPSDSGRAPPARPREPIIQDLRDRRPDGPRLRRDEPYPARPIRDNDPADQGRRFIPASTQRDAPRDDSRKYRPPPQQWDRHEERVPQSWDREVPFTRERPADRDLRPNPAWDGRDERKAPPPGIAPARYSPPYRSAPPPRLADRLSDNFSVEDSRRPDARFVENYPAREIRPRPRSPSPLRRPGQQGRPLADDTDNRPNKRPRDDLDGPAYYMDRERRAPAPYDYPPRPGSPGYYGIGGPPAADPTPYIPREIYERRVRTPPYRPPPFPSR